MTMYCCISKLPVHVLLNLIVHLESKVIDMKAQICITNVQAKTHITGSKWSYIFVPIKSDILTSAVRVVVSLGPW